MTKHLKWLGLTVLAFVAFATAIASSASATPPVNLPEVSGTRSYTGSAVGTTLFETVGGLAIECGEAPGTSEETSNKPPSGRFHINFKKCKSLKPIKGITCTGLGDTTAGEILVLGTWTLVFDALGTGEALKTAVLFTVESTHFECSGIELDVVAGQVLCLHTNPTTKSTTHEFSCKQTKGKPEETKYWNAAGEEESITTLLTTVNEGTGEASAQAGVGKLVGTTETFADQ